MANRARHRRDEDTYFSQRTWYRFQIVNQLDSSISSGFARDNGGATNMTPLGTRSSENWQLFPQGGRYFIRNWDYGSGFQLGLDKSGNTTAPAMFARNGSVSQQWTVKKVDGGWELTNGLLGNGTKLALPNGQWAPVMSGDGGNFVWNITRNERYATTNTTNIECEENLISKSADQTGPKNVEMYNQVVGFEVTEPSQSSSSTSLSRTTLSSSPASSQITSDSTMSSPAQSSSNHSTTPINTNSSALAPGAIAGIVIGAVAGLALLITAIFLIMRRKRNSSRNNTQGQIHEKPADPQSEVPVTEKYAYKSELGVPPAELAAPQIASELSAGGAGYDARPRV